MRIPSFLLRLLPLWDYICPRCKREVPKNSRSCPYCGERYGVPLQVPPRLLKDAEALENYVHKHVFPKVSVKMREYLTQYFTVLFSDGFESGDFSAWSGTIGSPTVGSAVVHHGAYSQDLAVGKTAYKNISAVDECYLRAYVYFSSVGAQVSVSEFLFTADNGAYQWGVVVWDRGDGERFYLADGSLNQYDSGVAVNTGQWYCIEVGYKRAASGFAKLWIDGNLKVDHEVDTSGYSQVNRIFSGNSNWGGITIAGSIDCIAVADAYIEPEGTTTTKTVTDSLGLSDAAQRNKSFAVADTTNLNDAASRSKTVTISDALGAAESLSGSKSPLIVADAVSLQELISTAEAVIKAVTDAVGTTETLFLNKAVVAVEYVRLEEGWSVNKALQITEAVSLVEAVQVGVGGAKQTRLFLLIGDFAVQLTGE